MLILPLADWALLVYNELKPKNYEKIIFNADGCWLV